MEYFSWAIPMDCSVGGRYGAQTNRFALWAGATERCKTNRFTIRAGIHHGML